VIYRALDGRIHIQSFGGGNPARVSWASHRGGAARDGNYRRDLFPAGTPWIVEKQGGFRSVSFEWRISAAEEASAFRIYRANDPAGSFDRIAELDGSSRQFVDEPLQAGVQHIYEIETVYGDRVVRSAPFALTAHLNNNL